MARNLLADSPIDTVIPRSRSTCVAKRRQGFGGALAMQPLGAAQVEKGFVDRQRFNERRQGEHRSANFASNLNIFRHVRFDDDGIGASSFGFEHRHCRTNAVSAGHVARRGDDAALAATDDDGFVGNVGIVALLDGRIERIAVDVRDRQAVKLGMAGQPRRTAGRASARAVRRIAETIAAEAHGTSRSQGLPASIARPRSTSAGSRPASDAKSAISLSSDAT